MTSKMPDNTDALREWLSTDTPGFYPVTEDALILARQVALAGWRERTKERCWPEPKDLSGSCKFSTLLVKTLFGGVVQGHTDHQYNVVNGKVLDLNADADDVQKLLASGDVVYRHDLAFFGNDDHLDSMLSCLPRVACWSERFVQLAVEVERLNAAATFAP